MNRFREVSENLILVGGGGHALAVLDVLSGAGTWNCLGYTDPAESAALKDVLPWLGRDEAIGPYLHKAQFMVGVGQLKSARKRIELFGMLMEQGAKMATVMAQGACISGRAQIEAGSVIMHQCIVQSGVRIGPNCIINDGAILEHEVAIGAHCHISTGSILNGGVQIGEASFVGSGSIIKEGVRIGQGCVIGAGSLVLHDIPDGSTAYGHPAKII